MIHTHWFVDQRLVDDQAACVQQMAVQIRCAVAYFFLKRKRKQKTVVRFYTIENDQNHDQKAYFYN